MIPTHKDTQKAERRRYYYPPCSAKPSLYGNSKEFPRNGPFWAGNSDGNSLDSRRREFPLWEFRFPTVFLPASKQSIQASRP